MNTLHKDLLIGLMFFAGMVSFISGQFIFSFIFSSVLFAVAAFNGNSIKKAWSLTD